MTMHIHIRDTFCHEDKTLAFTEGKAHLVTGQNNAGKTTTLAAFAAVATHSPDPYEVGKSILKQYIRKGADDGEVTLLIDDDESTRVVWRPGQGIEAPHDAFPISSPQSCGMVNFCAKLGPVGRAEIWEGMFMPDNPRELLAPHWNHSDERLDAMVDIIVEQGWKSALASVKSKLTEAKRRWTAVTKVPYGTKKAAEFLPAEWRDELYDASEESLNAKIIELQTALDNAKVRVAVDDSDNERIETLRGELAETHAEFTALKDAYTEREAQLKAAKAEVAELEIQLADADAKRKAASDIINAKPPYECPHCAKGIKFASAGKLAQWFPATDDAAKEASEHLGKAKVRITELEGKLNVAREGVLSLTTRRQEANSQVEKVRGRGELLKQQIAEHDAQQAKAGGNISASAKAALENQLEQARADLIAFNAKRKADVEHDNVVELDSMCKLLGPSGVRESLLKSKMGEIRGIVDNLCRQSGWSPIKISDDYSVTVGGQSVMFAAASEVSKAKWALQIASALLLNDKCVLLDAADILRDESWDGLVKVVDILAAKRPELLVVVAATSTDCPAGWELHQL